MLNIQSILAHIKEGVAKEDPRFIVKGDEHVTDTHTGITLHVYDNWFKVTYEDENVVTMDDFTKEEQHCIWEIKKLITDPVVLQQRETDYKPLQIERRKYFSTLYEHPTPLPDRAPTPEVDTTPYSG